MILFDFLEGGMNHLLRRNRPHRPAAPAGVDQRVPAAVGINRPAVHFQLLFVSFCDFSNFVLRADAIVMHFDLDGRDAIGAHETIAGHATPSITEP